MFKGLYILDLNEFLFYLFGLLQAADSFFVQLFLFLQITNRLAAKYIDILYFHVDFYLIGLLAFRSNSPIQNVENLFSR